MHLPYHFINHYEEIHMLNNLLMIYEDNACAYTELVGLKKMSGECPLRQAGFVKSRVNKN